MFDTVAETTANGCSVRVVQDPHAENPRDWNVHLGVLTLHHRRLDLPNEGDWNPDDYTGWAEFEAAIRSAHPHAVVLPVSLTDHSGISIYIGEPIDPWDSGRIGFIYATPEDIEVEFGDAHPDDDEVRALLENEVEQFETWLNGECYRYVVTNEAGDIVAECGGYLGDEDIKEALLDGVAEARRYRHPARSTTPAAGGFHFDAA